jgi:C_GCAxxG_C_C family probable redox protein
MEPPNGCGLAYGLRAVISSIHLCALRSRVEFLGYFIRKKHQRTCHTIAGVISLSEKEAVVESAKSYASQGFLCSEAVLLAVSGWLSMKSDLIPRVATGFGAGIGSCGSTCGALSGGVMALSLRFGRNDPTRRKDEGRRPYWFARELYERFEHEFGSTLCSEITGCDISTDEGRKKYGDENTWETKCRRYIASATGIVYDLIIEKR